MVYNQKRHVELLKRLQDLETLGRSLYQENFNEYLELVDYQGTLDAYVYWKNRTLFVLLLEKFANIIISGEEFSGGFFDLHQKVGYESKDFIKKLGSEKLKVKDLQLDPKLDLDLDWFGNLISFIRAECDNFDEDYQNEEVYNAIKEAMKDYY